MCRGQPAIPQAFKIQVVKQLTKRGLSASIADLDDRTDTIQQQFKPSLIVV